MGKKVYVIKPEDNTGTVISDNVRAGQSIEVRIGDRTELIKIQSDIPYGHKIAVRDIKKGEQILKYGLSIGTATEDIQQGAHVHIHNMESNRGRGDRYKSEKEKEVSQ
ncbi:altronate dehydratase small subunit [Caldalkalibacillus uzonensis]|uniref:Altronate dehydratase small subunit n=1 Tax=Caldalkalibacillus uzonensis TaxID=353224 RepID=A0ABU0CNF9_9BACI|nr:UxaA family hydrolase [Caldalkalibacillus uzonensis]MDQ0337956.1 altronate dehydratase small subunit [Caldalkalibacillus uzonensis]